MARVVAVGAGAQPHLLKRMEDRGFDEVDLRRMLQHAAGYQPDFVKGRLVVVTAYAVWEI